MPPFTFTLTGDHQLSLDSTLLHALRRNGDGES